MNYQFKNCQFVNSKCLTFTQSVICALKCNDENGMIFVILFLSAMLAGVTSSWARPILSLVASWAASLQRTRRWTRSWRITKIWSWQCLCPRPWSRASWASPQERRETKKLKKENVSRSQWKLTHEGIFYNCVSNYFSCQKAEISRWG